MADVNYKVKFFIDQKTGKTPNKEIQKALVNYQDVINNQEKYGQ